VCSHALLYSLMGLVSHLLSWYYFIYTLWCLLCPG